jgi:hypothetical protein
MGFAGVRDHACMIAAIMQAWITSLQLSRSWRHSLGWAHALSVQSCWSFWRKHELRQLRASGFQCAYIIAVSRGYARPDRRELDVIFQACKLWSAGLPLSPRARGVPASLDLRVDGRLLT